MYDYNDYASGFSCTQYGYGTYSSALTDSFYGNRYGADRRSIFTEYRQNNVEKQIARKYASSIAEIQEAYQGRDYETAMQLTETLKYEIDTYIDRYDYNVTSDEVLNVAFAAYAKSTGEDIKTTIDNNTQGIKDKTYQDQVWWGFLMGETDEMSAEEIYAKTKNKNLTPEDLKQEREGARAAGHVNGASAGAVAGAVGCGIATAVTAVCCTNAWNPIGWVGLAIVGGCALVGALIGGSSAESAKKEEQIARGDLNQNGTTVSSTTTQRPRTVVV